MPHKDASDALRRLIAGVGTNPQFLVPPQLTPEQAQEVLTLSQRPGMEALLDHFGVTEEEFRAQGGDPASGRHTGLVAAANIARLGFNPGTDEARREAGGFTDRDVERQVRRLGDAATANQRTLNSIANEFEISKESLRKVAQAVITGNDAGLNDKEILVFGGPPAGVSPGLIDTDVLTQQLDRRRTTTDPQQRLTTSLLDNIAPDRQREADRLLDQFDLGGLSRGQLNAQLSRLADDGALAADSFGPAGSASASIRPSTELDQQQGIVDSSPQEGPQEMTDEQLIELLRGGGQQAQEDTELDFQREARLAQESERRFGPGGLEEQALAQNEQLNLLRNELERELAQLRGDIDLRQQDVGLLIEQGRLTEAANARRDQVRLEFRAQEIDRQGQFLSTMNTLLAQPLNLPAFQAVGGISALANALGRPDLSPVDAAPGVQLGDAPARPGVSDGGISLGADPNFDAGDASDQRVLDSQDELADIQLQLNPGVNPLRTELAQMLRVPVEDLSSVQGRLLQQMVNQARRGNIQAVRQFLNLPTTDARDTQGNLTGPGAIPTGSGSPPQSFVERRDPRGNLTGPSATDSIQLSSNQRGLTPTAVNQNNGPVQPVQGNQGLNFFDDLITRATPFGTVARRSPRPGSIRIGRV